MFSLSGSTWTLVWDSISWTWTRSYHTLTHRNLAVIWKGTLKKYNHANFTIGESWNEGQTPWERPANTQKWRWYAMQNESCTNIYNGQKYTEIWRWFRKTLLDKFNSSLFLLLFLFLIDKRMLQLHFCIKKTCISTITNVYTTRYVHNNKAHNFGCVLSMILSIN